LCRGGRAPGALVYFKLGETPEVWPAIAPADRVMKLPGIRRASELLFITA